MAIGTFTVSGHPGTDTLHFAGRTANCRPLPPGRYTALIQTTNTARRSLVRTLSFTIVRG